MAVKADLESSVNDVLSVAWDIRDGKVVPDDDGVKLSNGAVKIEASYLYADLADSTTLARDFDKRTAARVVRAYLSVMTKLLRSNGAEIRSFDGDRVMGIFVGDDKRSASARCCLQMNWAFKEIVRPKVESKFPTRKEGGYTLEHCAGVDVGETLIVRGGVRGSNDLIAIGGAPNLAAILSDVRDSPYRSYITSAVYSRLEAKSKFSDGADMWGARSLNVKGKSIAVYRSSYQWSVG